MRGEGIGMGFFDGVGRTVRRSASQLSTMVTRATQVFNGIRSLPRLEPPANQPATIAMVLDEMRAVGATLPKQDGVADFHRMYLHVTELVDAAVASRTFHDAEFMERLDCVFASLYLDACRATDASRNRSWQPLFELRAQRDTAGLQYALAGMNAHINYDLALAVVRACRQTGRTLDSPGVRADFLAVNAILADAVQEVRQSYLDGLALHVDRAASPVLDLVGAWSIEAARDAAWLSATVQWAVQGEPNAHAAYLDSRARIVGLVTRQLLAPVDVKG